MKAKRENNKNKVTLFLVLYCLFIIVCNGFSCLFPERWFLLFQIWYWLSGIVWLILAAISVDLAIKLLKLNKLRNELGHRSGNDKFCNPFYKK